MASSKQVSYCGKILGIITVVFALIVMMGSCSPDDSSSDSSSTDTSYSESAVPSNLDAKDASSTKASEAESNSSPQSKALRDAELKPTTEYLEYSNKDVDPLSLVECSNADIKVSTSDTIDLLKLGNQSVNYVLSLDGEEDTRTINFIVRDTTVPDVQFETLEVAIDVGTDYDYHSNISHIFDKIDGDLPLMYEKPQARASGLKSGYEQFYDEGWYTVSGYVDTYTPGSYDISVTASDKNGNVKERAFTVIVMRVWEPEPEPVAAATSSYIINTNTGKFHHEWCSSVRQMSEKNKWYYEGTRDDVIAMGYQPCQKCNP